ncbi:hypothetical protein O9G_002765 [Rozella allomycis CSF55]|uniref:Uncharacterized protein n=1 Tax=Rozella allomycis (strain CSF55) TaxID=988480 RepID=A0A075B171_ROZAC|nr:hypothetical protein O9G_002765 [Rozella allomycis CSF55]|eukprot:EPZ34701.1 hypothetical protein O9G_002765 [Rozella allomycis CSF55]
MEAFHSMPFDALHVLRFESFVPKNERGQRSTRHVVQFIGRDHASPEREEFTISHEFVGEPFNFLFCEELSSFRGIVYFESHYSILKFANRTSTT